jgi:CheY-like chemotaxis protein
MTKVLIVDDSAIDRQIAERCVEQSACDIITAVDGNDAIRAIDVDTPDIVLTDLLMPEMDGLELVPRKGEKEHLESWKLDISSN